MFKFPEEHRLDNLRGCADSLLEKINGESFHLFFMGDVGCGKTYLANLIADWKNGEVKDHFQYHNVRNLYFDYINLIGAQESDKDELKKNHFEIMNQCNVVLDDIGSEAPKTVKAHDHIGYFIESRYDYARIKKSSNTIFTTNLESKEINQTYGSRVLDRIYGLFTVVKFGKVSYRSADVDILEG